jgi:hypothetical protein
VDVFTWTGGAEGGSSIQSSRFREVDVTLLGGKAGSDGDSVAWEVSFKLSAVGMSVARGFSDYVQ